ncbi:MAG: arginase [Gammaproteobacteria bacterium]|nr:arginase [Gammaproteobacteria bacterium]
MKPLHLIGYASGIAANDIDTVLGPLYLQQHQERFHEIGFAPYWQKLIYGLPTETVANVIRKLSDEVDNALAQAPPQLVVIGGDHSMGIGTWHSVMHHYDGSLGLIWVDAHLDAHTPESSHSKNIHGMPIAHLLGLWSKPIVDLPLYYQYLKPEHLCLIGIRSYEPEEYEALKKLGVRIYFIEEVVERGIRVVMNEARAYLESCTQVQGLSIDLDAFDPEQIPGVGCPEVGGIDPLAFLKSVEDFNWPIIEIAEYNPIQDTASKTIDFIMKLLKKLVK